VLNIGNLNLRRACLLGSFTSPAIFKGSEELGTFTQVNPAFLYTSSSEENLKNDK